MISTSTFFASLYSALITPLLAQLQAMIGTVISTMAPVATAMAVIAVAVSGAEAAYGRRHSQGSKRMWRLQLSSSCSRRAHIIHNISAISFSLACRIRWDKPLEQPQIQHPLLILF